MKRLILTFYFAVFTYALFGQPIKVQNLPTTSTGSTSDYIMIINSAGTILNKMTVANFLSTYVSTGLAIGTTSISSGSAGGVLYQGASSKLQMDDSYFHYNYTNHRLGIGSNSPTCPLYVASSTTTTPVFDVRTSSTPMESMRLSGADFYGVNSNTDGISFLLWYNTGNNRQLGIFDSGALAKNNSNTGIVFYVGGTTTPNIYASATDGTTKDLTLQNGAGNLAVGNGAPTQKLEVSGNFTIVGGVLYMQNSVTNTHYYSIQMVSGALVLTDTGSSTKP